MNLGAVRVLYPTILWAPLLGSPLFDCGWASSSLLAKKTSSSSSSSFDAAVVRGEEGGGVTETSRYTKAQRTNSNQQYIWIHTNNNVSRS